MLKVKSTLWPSCGFAVTGAMRKPPLPGSGMCACLRVCPCVDVCLFAGCGPFLTIALPAGAFSGAVPGSVVFFFSFSLLCNSCLGVPSELLMEWPEHL